VITIGSDNKVRISTKYKIDETADEINDEIELRLYENLQPLLGDDVSLEEFSESYILSSEKVGPTIADDIKACGRVGRFLLPLLPSVCIFCYASVMLIFCRGPPRY